MSEYYIPVNNCIENTGSSDGSQTKFYNDGYWYKSNMVGNEDEVEYLASGILKFSSLSGKEYLLYEKVLLNGSKACRSKSFLKQGESFFTFNHIHKNITGYDIHEKTNQLNSLQKKSDYVIEFFRKVINLDATDYLRKIFTLDYIILNEDRHFNNMGLIMDEKGMYRFAPIFDNGKALLNGNFSIKQNLPISENVKRVICRPFGGTHRELMDYYGKGFSMDVQKAITWVKKSEPSLQRDVLIYQLEQFR